MTDEQLIWELENRGATIELEDKIDWPKVPGLQVSDRNCVLVCIYDLAFAAWDGLVSINYQPDQRKLVTDCVNHVELIMDSIERAAAAAGKDEQ